MSDFEVEFELDSDLLEQIELSEPNRWKVIFHNDDVTTTEFVGFLLMEIFHHSRRTANDLITMIHNEGSGVVGVYDYEIAEEKAITSMRIAQENNFPLNVTIEEEFSE